MGRFCNVTDTRRFSPPCTVEDSNNRERQAVCHPEIASLGAIGLPLMRATIVVVLLALWSPAGASVQTPPPDEIAKCRSIADTNAQFACFHRLNARMKRLKEEAPAALAPANPPPPAGQVVPDAPAAANAPPASTAAAESIPACASLSNPQKRLSCYDNKWPPPPAASVPTLPLNN